MKSERRIVLILIAAFFISIGAVWAYHRSDCGKNERAYRARFAEVRQATDAVPIGASREAVEQFFARNHWTPQLMPEDGKPALVGQEIVKTCGSLVCDDEVVIRVTFTLDASDHVVGRNVHAWRTCL